MREAPPLGMGYSGYAQLDDGNRITQPSTAESSILVIQYWFQIATELSFTQKLALLGEEAKKKLASLFSFGSSDSATNNASYKSLPSIEDEAPVFFSFLFLFTSAPGARTDYFAIT